MTQITITRLQKKYRLSVEGHAGYAEAGRDIICAAVSILAYTWFNELGILKERGYVENVVEKEAEGSMEITFEVGDDRDKKEAVLTGLETILTGFRTIAKNFPQYVGFGGEI